MVGKRVVVVGGGISGLAAASLLLKIDSTLEIVLVEGSPRCGGRIHTIDSWDDSKLECGATWLHGTEGHPFYTLGKKLKLFKSKKRRIRSATRYILMQDGRETPISFREGIFLRDSHAYREYSRLLQESERLELSSEYSNVPLSLYIQEQLPKMSDEEKALIRFSQYFLGGIDGLFMNEIDLKGYGVYEELKGANLTVPEGMSTFPNYMVSLLEKEPRCTILLNSEVTDINWGTKKPTVVLKNGNFYDADAILCTVSLGVLKYWNSKNIVFHPSLEEKKRESIKKLGFGTVNKVFLFFPKELASFWKTNNTLCANISFLPMDTDPLLFKMNSEESDNINLVWQYQVSDSRCLIGWTIGDFAKKIESMSDDEVGQHCCKYLSSLLPEEERERVKPERVEVTRWGSNPLFRGSYSSLAVGSAKSDIIELSKPIPPLFFSGEATDSRYFSTTHGAYFSGERAAKEIKKFLSTR